MTYDVFISYSRKDTAIADRICAAFDRAGISYFIDRQGIAGGMEFPVVLAEAIENSRLFLFMASENSYQSKFTNNEVLYAFNEKPHNSLLPYIIDGSRMPRSLRFTFASINVRNITEHPIDPVLVDDVLRLLGRQRRIQSAPPQPSPRRYTQEELAEMYRKGDEYYIAEQYAKAVECFRIAAEQGYAGAQYNLGFMYDCGQGVTQDYAEAVRWYRKAADQGYADAQYELGFMYECGQGVSQDYAESVRWYRKAADQGIARAQYNLGLMYGRGQGVTQDYAEAVRWFRKAAEQGKAGAQYNLAICYKNGEGVPKDLSEARRWFQKAADQGNKEAKEQLRKL